MAFLNRPKGPLCDATRTAALPAALTLLIAWARQALDLEEVQRDLGYGDRRPTAVAAPIAAAAIAALLVALVLVESPLIQYLPN